MLKKAGIVVVAATAGLLAVSPLAFAGEDEGNTNIIPIQGNTLQVNPQVCGNQVLSGVGVAAIIAKAKGEAENDSKCKQDNGIDNDIDN